ncbi:DUF58 domain-containing protein [Ramlibacter ginsenosidimutans]|uniref:DUF58 domain-containing protein n=1 Tax=Ramlibacter ginsenosidimutans TaxID=502333 RepID=A0A934TWG2_9BURK|nr:DUF58 domain-containing protein [Ramlibacter ginsenosidimutans]MBK6008326.1 DUF58 domain-containing protein [Ramlibacter ginsenosidimutans]
MSSVQGSAWPAERGPLTPDAQAPALNPVAFARRRFRAWWQARLPHSDTMTLTQRNVYILPTRPGFMLAGTLLVLLVGSINYQLNLGYLLTFLLAGCAIVGMHVSHATLRGLTLALMQPPPQFAGASAPLTVTLANARASTRYGIGLAVLDATQDDRWAWTDVPPQGSCTVQVAFRPQRRGLHRVPPLTAETRFPLGTFRVWTVWRPAAQVLVYPAPEAHPPPLPAGEPRSGGPAALRRAQGTGEFEGVRAYRRGDPMKLVVWKKAARSGELVSRDTLQAQRVELWLDYRQCGVADPEGRLARLAAWVLQADRLGLDYGLRLPGQEVEPGAGEAHKRRCLEALALC